ncbi:MAG: BREX system ATP-binding domain-containing protein [Chloroflexota bacterium]
MDVLPSTWLDVIRQDYLDDFVRAGGAAVKVAVAEDDTTRSRLRDRLRQLGEDGGYRVAVVDAAQVKMQLVDRVFFAIAAQMPWEETARAFLARTVVENGYQLPSDPSNLTLTALAEANDVPERRLNTSIGDILWRSLFRDYAMSQEFRLAMVRLCRAQLYPDDEPAVTDAVMAWLRGELRRISEIKRALIFQRIARHNARHMLESLAHWLRVTGSAGLLLILDVTRCPLTVPREQRDDGVYYSRPATFDVYELLRQFIDGTDNVESLFVAVLAGREFTTDLRRSYVQYPALHYRLADEVHDQYRPNPLAALVRIADAS